MLGAGFHDTTPVPVNWPSAILSLIGTPVSADVELPVQVSVMMPPISGLSAAGTAALASSGLSAACCAGQTVLLLLKLASRRLCSLV